MEIYKDFKFVIDKEKVLNSIDCYSNSDVYEEVCEIYEALKKDIEKLVEPKAIFKFDKISERFKIDDTDNCTHIVLCILTIGRRVSEKTDTYFKNDYYMEGMLFDTMADILLGEYANQLYKNICIKAKKRGLGLTHKLSPGNADFPLDRQKDILEKLGAANILNVNVTDGFMLNPVKSVSFIFGADKKLGIPQIDHECSRCINTKCKMRKEAYIGKKNEDYINLTVMLNDKGIHINASKSKNIMETLKDNGIVIKSPCAGNGTCGKCKVRVIEGKVNRLNNNSILGEELLNKGWCLSCSTFLEEDCIIAINEQEEKFDILAIFDNSNININPAYEILNISFKNKNFHGQSLTNFINSEMNYVYKYTLKALKKLQMVINSKGFMNEKNLLYKQENLSLIVKEDTILNVCSSNDSNVYGIAIDIGTTTIALSLINLITGENVGNYSILNSQKQFGSDVITRIQLSNEGKMSLLNEYIRKDLIKGIRCLCDYANLEFDKIYNIAIAGNTTMLHFLIGLSCESLALFPFNTITTSILEYNFNEVFKENFIDCLVTILPGVSAYVGADIVAGMLTCNFNSIDKTSIMLDIGTNGEMAIGNRDKILCLATAAGPAFEGANITCGIGSIKGAISQVDINNGEITYKTLGDAPVQGICGSAVIDITAACLNNNIIDETGRFDEEKYSKGYITIAKDIKNEDIIFNQKDIREVQLAKSAIRSGIEILLKQFNVTYKDIDTFFLAGGFGYHMNVGNASTIGLIPEELKSKVKCVGNSSLGGTVRYLLDKESKNNLKALLENTSYIDISSDSSFNDLFINNMYFNRE